MIELEVRGIEEMERLFEEITPRHAINIMRATIGGIAGEVRDEAKDQAPKISRTLSKAIKVKRRRMRDNWVRADVIVETGRTAKNDAFYWRFVEYGTSRVPERPFILTSVRALESRFPQILRVQFIDKLEKAIAREKRRLAK